jgi:glycosidase
MANLRPHPALYEINTWIWLSDLSRKFGRPIDLSSVPDSEWDAIAGYSFDAVWLMGVWERSPVGREIANQNPELVKQFRQALPDYDLQDNVGSPYCVRRYSADHRLGGIEGLATARRALAKRGIKLILDFVPNHVAPDHPWTVEHPEYFIRGETGAAKRDPAAYFEVQGQAYARARDPNFPPWADVLQLNAFQPALRQAVVETIGRMAMQCDGVRCDMAMLVMNRVFASTWGSRAGAQPVADYWSDVIPRIKHRFPDFIFIAEAYWDLEWNLQEQGFDFCYDKRLYDRLHNGNAESIRLHLCADGAYQTRLLRFIENHDEARAAAQFSPSKEQAAAITSATLLGARLFHYGQFEGRKTRLPVFLARAPDEPANPTMKAFYDKLLKAIADAVFHEGEWRLC